MLKEDLELCDIVVVPYPYTDNSSNKKRPALVIGVPPQTSFIWVMMITSAQNAAMYGDVLIESRSLSGLSHSSVVRTAKIATVEKGQILKKIGTLDNKEVRQVSNFISAHSLSDSRFVKATIADIHQGSVSITFRVVRFMGAYD